MTLAFQEFLSAARKGHADSQFNLGLTYEQGIGVKRDETQVVVWYGKATAQGNSAAQFNRGVLYIRGDGVPVKIVAGVALLIMSATLDLSPDNLSPRNITGTRGLSTQMIAAAHELSGELTKSKNLLVPLDRFLEQSGKSSGTRPDDSP